MSTVGLDLSGIDNFAMPINEALAINNQSIDSIAIADADQTVIIGQTDMNPEPDTAHERARRPEPRGARRAGRVASPTARRCRRSTRRRHSHGTSLLDLDVDLDAALDLAAPVDAAVAANANVALPIDAAVSANIASPDATSIASASQDSTIVQDLDGTAIATGDPVSVIDQGETAATTSQEPTT